ncbi:putative E3 ubiquitin ligase PUB14 [Corchorus olitorius]|uniref:E3 ubiquitin ligase PUB14 n=1 Tax=Corchorus olitorius TaxID=93759 RepID=A0A1R3H7U4_9ROSI|nr:putative E3 ubiquitin ligase PUB14 [Corchorus olitorius]
MATEFIPIGTILAVTINQVTKTAQAAKDVVFDKESFNVLSKCLFEIEPVLKELQLIDIKDSQAARLALESLEANVKKATHLVDNYKNRARLYLLMKSSHIVNELNQVIELLSRADLEMGMSTRDVEKKILVTSRNKEFSGTANNLLEELARATGAASEIGAFRREIEEARIRKDRAESVFMEQVIALLSQVDIETRRDVKKKILVTLRNKDKIVWFFLVINLIMEIPSLVFDQLVSNNRLQYAFIGMLISVIALIISIVELIWKLGKSTGGSYKWKWGRRIIPWFYCRQTHKPSGGTHPWEFIGFACAVFQCIITIINYSFISRHLDGPIKISVWPFIFALGQVCSRCFQKSPDNLSVNRRPLI